MAYRASHRFADIAPTKVRPVADLIRHQPVYQALDTLRFMPNRGARMLEKVLKSALANAEDGGARGLEEMVVVDAHVDEGPRMKRIRPRARGSAFGILKRMSHIHVAIDAR
ncbi:50S ribosomal protein L22 [Planctomycetes bacterium Pan216]|uniref:Large ribosomal subunit protein uL22 n=1 Tax=Kolteria novifilia TaxID=2527975 RepID=A0A518AZL9_9BACT|nr:50S ribosomal protein L22 [Planctomycetes bacterium Pan216]